MRACTQRPRQPRRLRRAVRLPVLESPRAHAVKPVELNLEASRHINLVLELRDEHFALHAPRLLAKRLLDLIGRIRNHVLVLQAAAERRHIPKPDTRTHRLRNDNLVDKHAQRLSPLGDILKITLALDSVNTDNRNTEGTIVLPGIGLVGEALIVSVGNHKAPQVLPFAIERHATITRTQDSNHRIIILGVELARLEGNLAYNVRRKCRRLHEGNMLRIEIVDIGIRIDIIGYRVVKRKRQLRLGSNAIVENALGRRVRGAQVPPPPAAIIKNRLITRQEARKRNLAVIEIALRILRRVLRIGDNLRIDNKAHNALEAVHSKIVREGSACALLVAHRREVEYGNIRPIVRIDRLGVRCQIRRTVHPRILQAQHAVRMRVLVAEAEHSKTDAAPIIAVHKRRTNSDQVALARAHRLQIDSAHIAIGIDPARQINIIRRATHRRQLLAREVHRIFVVALAAPLPQLHIINNDIATDIVNRPAHLQANCRVVFRINRELVLLKTEADDIGSPDRLPTARPRCLDLNINKA